MDIEELKQFIDASDFTPETKQKVSIVLAGKAVLDYDTYAGVKEILQQELDSDFKEAGVDLTNDTEAQGIEKKYEAALEEIDASLIEDEKFIENETKRLDEISDRIQKIPEGVQMKTEVV